MKSIQLCIIPYKGIMMNHDEIIIIWHGRKWITPINQAIAAWISAFVSEISIVESGVAAETDVEVSEVGADYPFLHHIIIAKRDSP